VNKEYLYECFRYLNILRKQVVLYLCLILVLFNVNLLACNSNTATGRLSMKLESIKRPR